MTYSEFLVEARREFSSFRLIRKDESWLMKVIHVILLVVTLGRAKLFMTQYITTIGQTVYVPPGWTSWDDAKKLSILRHERVHMRQSRKYSFPLFAFLYVFFPLPMGLAYFRARFEWEGYQETMRSDAERHGTRVLADPKYKHYIVSHFTTAAYGWMWPFKSTVEKWFDREADAIRSKILGS